MIMDYETKTHNDRNGLLREQGFGFILHTPERAYQFSAETEVERAEWTKEIQRILETPLLPQVSIKLVEVAYLIFLAF